MKVKELVEELQKYGSDFKVCVYEPLIGIYRPILGVRRNINTVLIFQKFQE